MRPAIILFAKAPLAGHVKTRLQERLGADATLALHEAFVLDTLDKLLTLGDFADIELHTDIKTDVWRRPRVTVREQSGGDLGLKMIHALSAGLAEGRERHAVLQGDAVGRGEERPHRLPEDAVRWARFTSRLQSRA